MATTRATTLVTTAITATLLAASFAGTASATTYFGAGFNDFTNGTSPMTQAGTGLAVQAGGDLPNWTKAIAPGNLHAVQRAAGDFAIMLYDGGALTYATPIAANAAGSSYTVSFEGAIGVYNDPTQATAAGDYVEFRLSDANGIIARFDYAPTTTAFNPVSFAYTGTGLGGITLTIADGNIGDGRFGGAIDNITIADTTTVPEPGSMALLGAGLIGLGLVRRNHSA